MIPIPVGFGSHRLVVDGDAQKKAEGTVALSENLACSLLGAALIGVSRSFVGEIIKEGSLARRNRQIPGADDS